MFREGLLRARRGFIRLAISLQSRVLVEPDVDPRVAVPGQLPEGFEFEHPQQSGVL